MKIKYLWNMLKTYKNLLERYRVNLNCLNTYLNLFYMFSKSLINTWPSFIENNIWRCITYFFLEKKRRIKNFQKIF